jgi:hypothetical protein
MVTHSEVFYKRQLSVYNFCIFDGTTGNGTMCVWDETTGNRGVDEVSSCIWRNILDTLQPLGPNQVRTLVYWSDRCRGQSNNYQILCMFQKLIRQGYFTRVEQKFLCTGHSFLPCDRLFGIIEKHRKTSAPMIPEEWINVIETARPNQPFEIQRMNQQNILEFKSLEQIIPRPRNFQVTNFAWFLLEQNRPHILQAKSSHQSNNWEEFTIVAPNQRGRIANRRTWNPNVLDNRPLLPKYNAPIRISREKKADLLSMMPCVPEQYRAFFQNLPVVPLPIVPVPIVPNALVQVAVNVAPVV